MSIEKRNWKLIYGSFDGLEKKAIQLISKEMGGLLLRDQGVYTIHVLPCEQAAGAVWDRNVVAVGLYEEIECFGKWIAEDEIPEHGYLVKVMDHPEQTDRKLVLITAKEPQALFYGAVDFVDDYFSFATPILGGLPFPDRIFEFPLPDYQNASAPVVPIRTVFSWGHTINNYREYIENMARLKLNQLVLWNDFVPLNAKDVVDYAHEYGIKLLWGYSWGWSSNQCADTDLSRLDRLTEDVLAKYEREFRDTGADGIYFQSFTETQKTHIDGVLIAEAVTEFVNRTAGRMLEKYPELFLQFGLHATSVKDSLEFIARVDPRVHILWEDCGSFPYSNTPYVKSDEAYEGALRLTDEILALRDGQSLGLLFKGQMRLDWTRFVYQSGSFVLGESSPGIVRHDLQMLEPMWRYFQNAWQSSGRCAYEVAQRIVRNAKSTLTLGIVGQFAGGIWFSEALCAEILFSCDRPYEEIVKKVSARRCVRMV